MARKRNDRFAALLSEAGWSRTQAASAFNRVARENDHLGYGSVSRSHISMWVSGVQPSGAAPIIMCEALSRQLRRLVTVDELGFAVPHPTAPWELEWRVDPLTALNDLGRTDLDSKRRQLLKTAVYSAASFVLPDESWWQVMADNPPAPTKRRHVSRADVITVRELTAGFSRMDQRRGGGHGRTALVQYLHSDVAACLQGTFPDDQVRRDIFSAAGELAYLSGWMGFDNGEQALAQKYFVLALKLAATAGDPPLIGHILRAMAHQAIDLGFARHGLDLAAASMHGQRYTSATPKEQALLGVVHARGLAAADEKQAAATALLKAEDDLAAAGAGIEEPQRTFFFGEASLAHETACTLRDCGDRKGAIAQFQRSVRTRGAPFRRTHAVTLGYLGATQIAEGRVEEACATWTTALDTIEEGIYSGRVLQTVIDMRRLISPYHRRKIPAVAELDAHAAAYLAQVDLAHHDQTARWRMTQTLEISPIGVVVGGRTEPTDDHWSGEVIIRLNSDYSPEVVQGLEEFSHLVVVWHFHRASPDDVALHARSPRNNPAWPVTGTFVHRNHRRPNQIAQSFPRLIKVNGLDLHVTDLDAIDGTPIYDLAPYFTQMGPRGEIHQPSWPGEMLKDYWSPNG